LQAALGPLVFVVVRGLFLLPQLMSLYIVRRPGAAVVAGLFFGLVQAPFTPFGWTTVPVGLLTGVVCELPFLLTRYRNFRQPMLLLAGAVAGLLNLALVFVPLGYPGLAFGVQAALVVGYAVGGAVLGGLLAKLLADALAQTGVLSGYLVNRERREEV
jgi:energy-coupling factor transport system substrate-specific component